MSNQIIENKWNNRGETMETTQPISMPTRESNFVHLHTHSDYSMMDGCQRPKDMFQRCKELGMKKIAITNHGNIINMPQMIMDGEKAGVQVIPGCEVYMCWDYPAEIKDKDHKDVYHLVLLAKNQIGYQNLVKLTSIGHLKGKYYKPRVDRAMIERHSEGLICTSACITGYLAKELGKNNKEIEDVMPGVEWFHSTFKDDFYLEVQNHPSIPEQEIANVKIFEIGRTTDIPIVATCDSHYTKKEFFEGWTSLMWLQTGGKFGNDADNDYYLKSEREMRALFPSNQEVIEETMRVANKCEPIVFDTSIKYPPFDTGNLTAHEYLLKACEEGLEKRISEKKIDLSRKQEYIERYQYECNVLQMKNFSTYILTVADYSRWAKDQNILMAPARGSGAGSLVLFLTRTTEVDPMYRSEVEDYGLIFERFINPERDSFPDIDQDFQDDRRQEVIDYVTKEHGEDKVCSILTIGTLGAKSALRDACRRFELPFNETNTLSKLIPDGVRGRNYSLQEAYDLDATFRNAVSEPRYQKIFSIAKMIEGMAKSTGVHAAGVVISDETPLNEYIGLQLGKEGIITSSDSMKILEKLGFIKFDFLGLKTMTIISNTLKWIARNHGKEIDIYNDIPYDDPKVYDMICEGKLSGIFQLGGSSGFREVTMKMAPRTICNISDINAIYRPGPLDNGFPEQYSSNKDLLLSGKQIKYGLSVDNPVIQKGLEEILSPTYGVLLYQEQIQFLVQLVAGYSLGKADLFRRAIGKKDKAVMEEQRNTFVPGCMAKGISKDSANVLFEQLAKFADYCFNKSHSVSYSITGYWTAWLKYYYPYEFIAANLTMVKNDQDKTIGFINTCKEEGIAILPPDINESEMEYNPTSTGIRFGLGAIKGLGNAAIRPILNERKRNGKFLSYLDLIRRLKQNSKVKKSDIVCLVKTGCFNSLSKGGV